MTIIPPMYYNFIGNISFKLIFVLNKKLAEVRQYYDFSTFGRLNTR